MHCTGLPFQLLHSLHNFLHGTNDISATEGASATNSIDEAVMGFEYLIYLGDRAMPPFQRAEGEIPWPSCGHSSGCIDQSIDRVIVFR